MISAKRNSLLSPQCGRLISSDEPVCPYCKISKPASWWRNNALVRVYLQPDHIVKSIIFTNIILFAISTILSPTTLNLSMNPFTLFSPSDRILMLLGATGTIPINQYHRWWTLISASYLHGGILHILFNMLVLRQIAPLILHEYGFNRSIILYTLGGVIGFYVSYLAGIPFTIGASASLFALIGSILYYGKSRGGTYGQVIFKQIAGWVIGLFMFGFLIPGINNWAHGGGIAGGILLGFLLGYNERKKETYFHKILALSCIVSTMLILIWAVASTFYYRITIL